MFGYTGQVKLKGYDNMTGIGTPRGQPFISAELCHGSFNKALKRLSPVISDEGKRPAAGAQERRAVIGVR